MPRIVGGRNEPTIRLVRVLLSDLSGRSNIRYKLEQQGLERLSEDTRRELLERGKHLEYLGYELEAAEGTFELLVRGALHRGVHPATAPDRPGSWASRKATSSASSMNPVRCGTLKTVLDTNLVVPMFTHPTGPAGRIWQAVIDGRFRLVISPPLIAQLHHSTNGWRV